MFQLHLTYSHLGGMVVFFLMESELFNTDCTPINPETSGINSQDGV